MNQRKPRNNGPRPTKEWLERKYIDEGLSSIQIGKLLNRTKGNVMLMLRKYGIPRRGWSKPKLQISRGELYDWHVVQGLTAVKIAARLGCHNTTISRLIRGYGLDPQRPLVNLPMVPPLSRDELWKLYWVDELSTRQIGTRYGASGSTAQRWLRYWDIPRRKWNGGEVHRTYVRNPLKGRNVHEFNAQERERIFQRDGYQCRMPGCGSSEQLEVNHILPIKYGGSHHLSNGITLCHSCHASIYRRELEFITLFQNLI